MTTLDQELTGRYVAAGGDHLDLDARRVARAVFVRDTIRTLYNADKKFGNRPRRQRLAGRARRRSRSTPDALRQRRQPAVS